MTDQVNWAKKIAALARTGLHYSQNHFDTERYEQLLDIAAEMLADAADTDKARVRAALEVDEGYITPKFY